MEAMTDYLQPHEGVLGVERTDDLLSLDEGAVAHRDALISMARHLQDATLVGNPAPRVERMYRRISDPQVGDLVVEVSAMHSADAERRIKGFGLLIDHRDEWWQTDKEWEQAVAEERKYDPDYDEPRSVDHAWYVQYGSRPADICRWTNCSFVVIPIDRDAFDQPTGTRNPDGSVTLTKDDLLGALGDAGFALRDRPRREARREGRADGGVG